MAPIYRAAESRGIFVIGITLGGYASSTRREGRRAVDYVLETRIELQHFGVEKFVSFGWSSGGLGVISDLQDSRCKAGVRKALAAGPFGIIDDAFGNESALGIGYSTLKQPIAIYQGMEDRVCTPAHGHFLADRLENAEFILLDDQGHLSLIYDYADNMVNKALSYFD